MFVSFSRELGIILNNYFVLLLVSVYLFFIYLSLHRVNLNFMKRELELPLFFEVFSSGLFKPSSVFEHSNELVTDQFRTLLLMPKLGNLQLSRYNLNLYRIFYSITDTLTAKSQYLHRLKKHESKHEQSTLLAKQLCSIKTKLVYQNINN